MNIDFMGKSNLVADYQNTFENAFDEQAGKIKFIFLAQRFIGIFSFVFGISLAIQKQKISNEGIDQRFYFAKRFALLFFFGAIHLFFFFMGDVLMIYVFLGMMVLMFSRLSDKILLLFAFLIFWIPALMESLKDQTAIRNGIESIYDSETIKSAYTHFDLKEMMKARLTEYFYYNLSGLEWNRTSLAMMLLGFVAGRNSLHENYIIHKRKFLLAFLIAAVYVISFSAWCFFGNFHFSFPIHMLYNLHLVCSIYVYLFLLVGFFRSGFLKKFRDWIVLLGQNSLSNYLFQSLLGSFIFTAYGFALFAKTSPTLNVLIVLGIYTSQIILVSFYLRFFRRLPLEALMQRFLEKK